MSQQFASNRLLLTKPTFAKVIAWVCIALFSFCAVMSWRAGEGKVTALFLIFVAVGIFILVFAGSMQMNQEFVFYKCLLANYSMKWNEVEKIEIDAQGGAIVFIGKNKQLAALGPSYWSGSDKREMLALLASKIKSNAIQVEQSPKALFKMSKNTKAR